MKKNLLLLGGGAVALYLLLGKGGGQTQGMGAGGGGSFSLFTPTPTTATKKEAAISPEAGQYSLNDLPTVNFPSPQELIYGTRQPQGSTSTTAGPGITSKKARMTINAPSTTGYGYSDIYGQHDIPKDYLAPFKPTGIIGSLGRATTTKKAAASTPITSTAKVAAAVPAVATAAKLNPTLAAMNYFGYSHYGNAAYYASRHR